MAAKTKAYEQFGQFILFKKLEADSFSELWRAARIENGALGATVAIRRFSGGNREALASAAWTARQILPGLSGVSFVRDQSVDTIDGVPFIAYEYAGGRSLRHVIDRARGGTGATPMPVPIDQAIAIVEKVALSLATTEELRFGGDRLTHGGLIPQLVWITDEGEIRVAGQQLGRGLVSSLRDTRVASDIARYFAPEYRQSGVATKSSEVFSLGALLYAAVTGEEPPDAADAAAVSQALQLAKTTAGAPLPQDIRAILEKSLTADTPSRYGSVADMKKAISAVAQSGKYSATTFNLAFYLSTLLKKEMEGEAIDRDRESKTNVAPYLEPAAPVAPPVVAAPAPSPAPIAVSPLSPPPAKAKSKAPVAVAAAVAVALIAVGAWFMLGSKSTPAAAAPQLASAAAPIVPPAPKQAVISEPLVASATPETTTAPPASGSAGTAQLDEAAKKKAFEEAVRKELEQQLQKLQADYTRELQQKQARNAPVTSTQAPATQPVAEERPPSAAELDQQRLARQTEAMTASIAQQSQTQQPAVTMTQAPAPVQVPQIREGDVVDGAALDVQPAIVRKAMPIYPPMAARQKITGTVLISALISERGDVIDVKVLKGEGRLGFDEAAIRAVRQTKFSPATKDGKRVKTWVGIPIQFK